MIKQIDRQAALLWLGLIVVAAAVLRFKGLDFQSYWYDELFSAHISNPEHSFTTVVELTLADVHPPFFQLMMWLSYKLLGYTEWAGRLPSALVSTATIGVIYGIGAELFSRRVGLYAAALAVANYYLVYYGQEARSYAFLYFLCSLSFFFFVRALRREGWLNVGLYVVATLLLLYTHYFGFLLVLAQGLSALICLVVGGWQQRALLLRAGVAAGLVVLCVLPLLPVITGHAAINEFWIPQPGPGFVAVYFVTYFASPVIALALAVLVFAGIGAALHRPRDSWMRLGVLMLLAWLLIGYALPWLRGFIGQPVITDRNTIMLIVPLLLLAANGLAAVPHAWAQRILLAALVGYSLYFLFVDLNYYERVKKNQFRETAAAMGAFEPRLPVYTLKFNDTKYNVYFTQQESGLVARDITELEPLLREGTAPGLLWLADGHANLLDTEVDDRHGLIELARIRNRGTVALLLLNPAAAVSLTLGESGTATGSAALPDTPAGLAVVVAGAAETAISAAIVDPAGNLRVADESEAGLPVVLSLHNVPPGSKLELATGSRPGRVRAWLVAL